MKTTKSDLFNWVKDFYGNDWEFIMEQLTGQDQRQKADEYDVDEALARKFQTKEDVVDIIYNLSEEGQKYLEEKELV